MRRPPSFDGLLKLVIALISLLTVYVAKPTHPTLEPPAVPRVQQASAL